MKIDDMQDNDEFDGRPSKSARKRASHTLQDLGVALIDLRDEDLEALPLPETLRDAVTAARTITSRGALLRQYQYIGKLMRKIDPEPIRAALAEQVEQRKIHSRRLNKLSAQHVLDAPGAAAKKE